MYYHSHMNPYDHNKIEKKWQKVWESKKPNKVKEDAKKPKFYALIEFPFPSGDGLHVGHIRSNTAMDIIARKKRREGFNVLYPIGWDAFGLPTENYAIKTGIQPAIVSKKNSDTFRKQLKALGFSFDWSREIDTTDPKYYKWTQWIFLQFFKKGLAYKKKMTINWCPKDLIGLSNEEVVDGCCERCGTVVEQKEKEQWMLAITKYAERLDKDLDDTDFLEKIKIQQRNWIGKSEGVNFKCKVKDLGIEVEMYNSVPQTFRAETFTVIAPEHKLVSKLVSNTEYEKPVLDFIEKLRQKRASKDFDAEKEMEGIFTGRYIENFAGSGRDLPIWIASYVVADYGTGIVNASAHDTRDFAFAKKFNIPLHPVAEALIVRKEGDDAIKNDVPFVERNAVVCVIKHWSEDKYLCHSLKINDWKGFVVGGIDDGEDPIETGLREIKEETGYLNVAFEKKLGGTIHSQFYQNVKKQNRFAHFTPLLFKLKDDQKIEISEEEKKFYDIHWLSSKEVSAFINRDDMKLIWERAQGIETPVVKNGILTEPQEFKGREWSEVRNDVIDFLVKNGWATRTTNFKLRDWVFSRQRYWGEPIPVVHCEKCGIVALPEKDLPLKLPKVENYTPSQTGESPLAKIDKWVNTKCPTCKGKARRETDTMPNWAGSSWYYLRYIDPKNKKEFASQKNLNYWGQVDWYNGGMEHTTLHLLYSRFWHKFLFDLGLVPNHEPYKKRTSHGLILAEGGEKMSKSKGNVINPDSIIQTVGADTLRVHEMFMGPFDQAIAWDTNTIAGSRRFIERVWKLKDKISESDLSLSENENLEVLINKTIKKVSEDIEEMKFNTAISAMMIVLNELEKQTQISKKHYEIIMQLLAPFAPHVTEELWSMIKNKGSIHASIWPKFDPEKTTSSQVKIMIQINGKVRAFVEVPTDTDEEQLKTQALEMSEVKKWLNDLPPKKIIFVKNRLINIVV